MVRVRVSMLPAAPFQQRLKTSQSYPKAPQWLIGLMALVPISIQRIPYNLLQCLLFPMRFNGTCDYALWVTSFRAIPPNVSSYISMRPSLIYSKKPLISSSLSLTPRSLTSCISSCRARPSKCIILVAKLWKVINLSGPAFETKELQLNSNLVSSMVFCADLFIS